jgi:hypothetical protein
LSRRRIILEITNSKYYILSDCDLVCCDTKEEAEERLLDFAAKNLSNITVIYGSELTMRIVIDE